MKTNTSMIRLAMVSCLALAGSVIAFADETLSPSEAKPQASLQEAKPEASLQQPPAVSSPAPAKAPMKKPRNRPHRMNRKAKVDSQKANSESAPPSAESKR